MHSAVAVCLQLCNRGLHGLIREVKKSCVFTEGCWLIALLYISYFHSMLWNQILSLDAVCASFRRLRSGGSGWQVDSEKWWPVGTQLLYLWGRWGRSVVLINLLQSHPVFLKLHCCDCWTAVILPASYAVDVAHSRTPPQTHQRESWVSL